MQRLLTLLGIVILLSALACGCSPSLVYSPSMNLPARPLKGNQMQLLGGVGNLAETRPDKTEDSSETAFGCEGALRIGLCEHFTLQFKGWKDLSDNVRSQRYGTSFSVLVTLNNSSKSRFTLIPTAALVFGGGDLEGGGGGLFLSPAYNPWRDISFYLAFGPAFGMRKLEQENKQWGWGLLANCGASFLVRDRLTVNVELAGVRQVNKYDDIKDFMICPSLNLGYIF